MIIPIEICKKKKRPSKKGKFCISINEQGRSKYYIKKLKYFLKEKYPFLVEECSLYREKSLKAAKPGDLIVFGTGKKYDYTTMCVDSFVDDEKISDKLTGIDLEGDWKLVKKTIERYVHKNYPWKAPQKKRKSCYIAAEPRCPLMMDTRRVVPTPVVATIPCRPVRVASTPRSCKRDWNMQVNNTYVLLTDGDRYETRKIQKCGNRETVRIDNHTYTIRRDNYGKGIVV